MIQSILFFALGFLTALFLGLLIAPAIWRRAVVLTRKRVEASVPLTMNEIQADKDRMRAEFAMSTRRLEMNAGSLREKTMTQTVDLNRAQDEIRRLKEDIAKKDLAWADLEAKLADLRAQLSSREEALREKSEQLSEADRTLSEMNAEFDKLGHMYDEATLTGSSRQIELVARETAMERLMHEAGDLRNQRKDADRRAQSVEMELKAAQEALRLESKRSKEFERKVEQLMTTLADRETKLDYATAELERQREERKSTADIAVGKPAKTNGHRDALDDNAQLREQIQVLAAQVVSMTATLEGPSSEIDKILTENGPRTSSTRGSPQSLADRVSALRKAAAPKRSRSR